ncbi:DUF2721 domain-containing protein [Lichenifustis flavocetrariae]|uniref:DUF2721 domain-containing protein n=1 Tax=Lichenifustis flavocetrariae TaxID=2949735 RepID=A0AA41YT56_9HYPH|nr:DUF2721 domain-containing protein [Lichenifustis flavocetrariae]MCW6508129.1 DUF2721 domain-containing protein [Lichenifustis flavocetrariae]
MIFGLGAGAPASLDSVTHIIQVALTPVFLLSGIGALLNVFATRLGRVADQLDKVTAELRGGAGDPTMTPQIFRLRQRLFALDLAVVAAAIGGGATCGATIALFIGALRDDVMGWVLFALFGGALICTLIALCAFLAEMLISSAAVRLRLDVEETTAEGRR